MVNAMKQVMVSRQMYNALKKKENFLNLSYFWYDKRELKLSYLKGGKKIFNLLESFKEICIRKLDF